MTYWEATITALKWLGSMVVIMAAAFCVVWIAGKLIEARKEK